jgi:hypothetical protein
MRTMNRFSLLFVTVASLAISPSIVHGFSVIKRYHGNKALVSGNKAAIRFPFVAMSSTVQVDTLTSYSTSEDCNIRNIAVIAHGKSICTLVIFLFTKF